MIPADPGAAARRPCPCGRGAVGAEDTAAIDYIARFLAGVARSAHDRMLEDAATARLHATMPTGGRWRPTCTGRGWCRTD